MEAIGIKLKKLRKTNNYRQDQIARKLDCSTATYCKFENGGIDITYSRLEQLAALYGVKLYELFLAPGDQAKELKDFIDLQHAKISALTNEIIELQEKMIRLHVEIYHQKLEEK